MFSFENYSQLTNKVRRKIEHVDGDEKSLMSDAKHTQHTRSIVEPHDRVGSEVGNLVRCLSVLQRGVHLYPVTGYVQSYQQLEQEEVGGVEIAQHHYET